MEYDSEAERLSYFSGKNSDLYTLENSHHLLDDTFGKLGDYFQVSEKCLQKQKLVGVDLLYLKKCRLKKHVTVTRKN